MTGCQGSSERSCERSCLAEGDGRRVGHVVAVAEARDQRGGDAVGELLGMLSRVWSVCGQSQMESDDRLPFRNALVDLVRVDGHAAHSEGRAPVRHAQTARHRSGSPQAHPGCGEMSSGSARLSCTIENGLDVGGCGDVSLRSRLWLRWVSAV
jgi:hypothetical protein